MTKTQVIFLGPPGSGKGTQAARLALEQGHHHLSTGELLRKEVSSGSDLGKCVEAIMNAGNLVDDTTMIKLLKAHYRPSLGSSIFDGFPRNAEQAKLLDETLLHQVPSLAIHFVIEPSVVARRLLDRRFCPSCEKIYSLSTAAPQKKGLCDSCGGHLQQRKDDDRDIIQKRLTLFENTIPPVLAHYKAQGRLRPIDAAQEPDKVFSELKTILEVE